MADFKKSYVMLLAPHPEEYATFEQIELADNTTGSGKHYVDSLIDKGYSYIGTISTDEPIYRLRKCFKANSVAKHNNLCRQIRELADNADIIGG